MPRKGVQQDRQFVFVNTTDDPKEDRPRIRRLVHSHVSRLIWQQHQDFSILEADATPAFVAQKERFSDDAGSRSVFLYE
ncbi:hypothetical protein H2198_010744, partial [Neophaeococcomyces mojaviensis]